ncbi:4Fe-4S dicluster domain-containing protein [Adlercreutzia sp. ZJ138]|uniref:4Fe-4S binding protein n=1 Tax=Adlercreutzia sp. ZJ138 TaxID=2709405 RepID=UPI001F154238|nr:4Fe-4S dicluster domain-containing protein [Adlercreutzia sp. ZJ138]
MEKCQSALHATQGKPVIACRHILDAANGLYDPEKVVSVRCLGRVDESLLVSLVSLGAERITLVATGCEECPHERGAQAAKQACLAANLLLKTWGSNTKIQAVKKLPSRIRLDRPAEYDNSRREFLSELKGGAKTAASLSVDFALKKVDTAEEDVSNDPLIKVNENGVLPQGFPERRKLLLDALDNLGEPEDATIACRLWSSVDINVDRCSSCRMCATFCPTGAIFKFHTKKGHIGVKHRPRQCVSCGTCSRICHTGALHLSSEVSTEAITSASVSRFVMKPVDNPPSHPQSIVRSLRKLIKNDQVYER